jgi:DNA polymerase III subunit alpha
MKIALLPPDINKSLPRFSVERLPDGTKAVRYALAALKGVGEEAMKSVVAERARGGPYQGPHDFARRLEAKAFNKRQMESLSAAGAFDTLNPDRASVFASAEILLRYAAAHAEEKQSAQASLFGGPADTALPAPALETPQAWEPLERLRHEFDAIGFYLSAHPLEGMQSQLERLKTVPFKQVSQHLQKSPSPRLRMAGIVVRKQERTSQKGNRFAFVQVSDPTGVYEVMMFSDVLGQARPLLESGTPILLTVDAERKAEDEIRFLAQSVEPLTAAVQTATRALSCRVADVSAPARLRDVLAQGGAGRIKVSLTVDTAQGPARIDLPGAYGFTDETLKALRAIPGLSDVRET